MVGEKVFGYSYLGTPFQEVLRLSPDAIHFKGRDISWPDVVAYRASPDFFPDLILAALGSPKPRLAFYLRNGRIINIRGDLLARHGNDKRRERGVPLAFAELVDAVRERGLAKWSGPKEETILFNTAFALFAVGLFLGSTGAMAIGSPIRVIAAGVVAGVLLAQGAFLLAPAVGRRIRRIHILASG